MLCAFCYMGLSCILGQNKPMQGNKRTGSQYGMPALKLLIAQDCDEMRSGLRASLRLCGTVEVVLPAAV